jgi:hypothetical protein
MRKPRCPTNPPAVGSSNDCGTANPLRDFPATLRAAILAGNPILADLLW